MMFIDGDKMNNWTYFNLALKMSYPRDLVVVDNLMRRELTAEEARDKPQVQGARKIIEMVGKDGGFDAPVIQTVPHKNNVGLLFAVVNWSQMKDHLTKVYDLSRVELPCQMSRDMICQLKKQ
jgi:predicted O-methyltransferase YrrM